MLKYHSSSAAKSNYCIIRVIYLVVVIFYRLFTIPIVRAIYFFTYVMWLFQVFVYGYTKLKSVH